jgi:two-component system response regulator FixJ
VDGDPAVRDSISTLLGLNNLAVETYASGSAFLSALDDGAICCVVCEADLPDGTGLELFITCRERYPMVRFAMVTSRSDPARAAAARRLGVDAVFHKPLVSTQLREFVRRT